MIHSNLRNGKGNTGLSESSKYITKIEVFTFGREGYNNSSCYVSEMNRSRHVKISSPNFK